MSKQFINSKKVDVYDTYFLDEINVSYFKLVETFGKETYGISKDKKCECYWSLLFNNNTVATIYDWKNNKKYCGKLGISKFDNTVWHIGGFNKEAVILIKNELGI